jgi:hypothetical protein
MDTIIPFNEIVSGTTVRFAAHHQSAGIDILPSEASEKRTTISSDVRLELKRMLVLVTGCNCW